MSWSKVDLKKNIAYIFEGEKLIYKEKDIFKKLNDQEIIFTKKDLLKFFGKGVFDNLILSEKLDKELFIESEDLEDEVTIPIKMDVALHPYNHKRGLWIWKLNQVGEFNDFLDICQIQSIKRIYLKVYDAHSQGMFWDHQCTKELTEKLNAHDIEVWGWGYTYRGNNYQEEKEAVKKALECGIQGFVLDIEKEAEADVAGETGIKNLEQLLTLLKEIVPQGKLGYTSLGAPQFHSDVPYSLLNKYCDLQFPQFYLEKFSFENSNEKELEECLKAHLDMKLFKPIIPIFSSEPDAKNPMSVQDLQKFISRYPGSCLYRADLIDQDWKKIDYHGHDIFGFYGSMKKVNYNNLQEDTYNDDNEELQKVLISLGFLHCYHSGYYGNLTRKAIKECKVWLNESNKDNKDWRALEEKGNCDRIFFEVIGGDITDSDSNKNAKLASFAQEEASKNLTWSSMKSEAEKYLQPFRSLLGVTSKRFAWCGCFAWYCAVKSGVYNLPKIAHKQNPYSLTFASVYGWIQWAKANRFWISLEKAKKEKPQKGDFVIFDWSDDGSVDHIGIVVEVGNRIMVAEGNTSNMSAIKDRTAEFNKGKFEGLIRIEEY